MTAQPEPSVPIFERVPACVRPRHAPIQRDDFPRSGAA